MSILTRRVLLGCLAGLASAPALAATPNGLPVLDQAAAKQIGQAWLALRPTARADLERSLSPRGSLDIAAMRARVAADFRRRRVFDYQGWRLSDTEGRLFALLALS
jgi:hypothetical protein